MNVSHSVIRRCFPSYVLQIKLDIVPDKGWQSEDMFVPAGYHLDTSISDEEGSPPENDQASFSYPAGLGSVLMNGCFGTGYKEGDPCYVAKWKMDACLVCSDRNKELCLRLHDST